MTQSVLYLTYGPRLTNILFCAEVSTCLGLRLTNKFTLVAIVELRLAMCLSLNSLGIVGNRFARGGVEDIYRNIAFSRTN